MGSVDNEAHNLLSSDMQDIENPRLANLKEKTLRYRFKIIHVPGIKNRIADALSRFPSCDPQHHVEEEAEV